MRLKPKNIQFSFLFITDFSCISIPFTNHITPQNENIRKYVFLSPILEPCEYHIFLDEVVFIVDYEQFFNSTLIFKYYGGLFKHPLRPSFPRIKSCVR